MKTVFNIPVNSNLKDASDLLIEFGDNSIHLLWTSGHQSRIEGYQVFAFEGNENYKTAIDKIQQKITSIKNSSGKIKVVYNFKESLLVPVKLYNKELSNEMLSVMFGDDFDASILTEKVDSKSIQHIYSVPKSVEQLFNTQFNHLQTAHSTSLQIKEAHEGDRIQCMVYHELIKVIVFKEGKLQLVQQFYYEGPNDVAYHLLNICKQHQLNPSEISLRLSGMIVKESQLFQSLYNCFLDIDFALPQHEIQLSESLSNLPVHFFTHLIELTSCE